MIRSILFISILLGIAGFTNGNEIKCYYFPKEGFIQQKETAIKIAAAVWKPLYGELDKSKNVNTILKNDVWYVSGYIKGPVKIQLETGYFYAADGTVVRAEISKKTCKILRIIDGDCDHLKESKCYYIPTEGFVPNAETAIEIALAVWEPIYGKECLEDEKPFKATLENDVWYVEGHIDGPKPGGKDKDGNEIVIVTAGGVAEAEISKGTGEVLRISHGR